MSTDPPASKPERFRHWITDVEVSPGGTDPNCKFSARLFIDEELVCNLPWIDSIRPLIWTGLLLCEVSPTSMISIRLCKSVRDRPRYYNFPPFCVSDVDEETGEATLELPEAAWVVTIKSLSPTTATQLFPDALEKFKAIEGVYDSLEPDQTVKYPFKNALQFATLVAEAHPECTARLSFLIYKKVWEVLIQSAQIDDITRAILHSLRHIADIVDIMNQASSSMLTTALIQSKEPVSEILALLEDTSVAIFNRYTTNDLVPISPDGVRSDDTYDVEAYLVRLQNLQRMFLDSWSPAALSPPVCPDSANIDNEPLDTLEPYAQTAADETTKTDWHEIMNLLRPTNPCGYNPDQACLDGTREVVLNKIITWTQNRESPETFMWISGQIGMGKTAVATSLCQRLDSIQALAGSFFYQCDNPSSNSPLTFINNLICQLAMNCPPYARELTKAVQASPMLCNAHFTLRYQGLVLKPFEQLKRISIPITLALVIDGLDECSDRHSRGTIIQKLYEMSRLAPWLKVILTGRPLRDIQQYFHNSCPHKTVVHLQDYDASHDIHAYIQRELGELATTEGWPKDSISKLCSMTEGVFLWATLAANYIKESHLPTLLRLKRLLKNQKSRVTDHFDALYTKVLKAVVLEDEDEVKDTYLRGISIILATSEREHLNIPEMFHRLLIASRIDQLTLDYITKNLSPLLIIMEGRRFRFYHSNFKDFIAQSSRSGDLFILPDRCEAELAACCFEVMERDLRFNICELETSYLRNNEVPDLKLRIDSHIGPALKYACTHWIEHFTAAPNEGLLGSIRRFMEGPQLMYWIEALSLLGRIDVAISALSKLALLDLTRFSNWEAITIGAKDGHRFLLSFYDSIAASTPHLYVSALALSPHESITAQRMRPYFPNTISIAGGISKWHPCVRFTVHPYAIQSLSISPDGLRIVVGYPDGSLGLWDKQTGECITTSLVSHTDPVTCVVYSPNGNMVASSSHDATIRVWDVEGGLQDGRVLAGHSGPVHSVAFSPNSDIIASGSSDKSIRLWDPSAIHAIHRPFVGHLGRVSSVAFSSDGTKLVSGSWDKTVRVWSVDLIGQQMAGNPLVITGHSDSITCVAFSPDGLKVASGSVDKTIQLWDGLTGTKPHSHTSPAKHSDTITSVTFSSNGKHLASSSLDGAIHLWDTRTSVALSRSFGHFSPVNLVTFSPDGSYVVSGSADMTTRVWEIDTLARPKAMTSAPLVGHSSQIISISVSSDGSRIVSGSGDNTVRIWDIQSGAQIGNPFTGHSGCVYSVAISPDGAHIVSGSNDKTMKHWDTATHINLHSYQHSHIIYCTAFSPNGALITFGSHDNKVYVWDFAGWKIINQGLQGHSGRVFSVAFSPDGAYIASASVDQTVILWDVGSHSRSDITLSGHTDWVRSVTFSPCGSRLASASDDKTIRVWDRQTGITIHTLAGHTNNVMGVTFSPDGAYIASGSYDRTVRLWNSKTGQTIGQLFTGHSDYVRSVTFSPDANYLISCSDDRTIRIWDLEASPRPAAQAQGSSDAFCWPSNPYKLSPHPDRPGWVTNDNQSLILWLPAHYQQRDQFLDHIPSSQLCLDYSKFVHGTAWTEIACDSIRFSSR